LTCRCKKFGFGCQPDATVLKPIVFRSLVKAELVLARLRQAFPLEEEREISEALNTDWLSLADGDLSPEEMGLE